MMSHEERNKLWIIGAALLAVFLGVGIIVSSSSSLGLSIVLAASLILIGVGVRLAISANNREKKQLLVVVCGYCLGVLGFAISVFYEGGAGPAIVGVGALIILLGYVIFANKADREDPRWAKTLGAVLVVLFGLLPCLYLCYHAAVMALYSIPLLFSSQFLIGFLRISIGCMCLYGTFTLFRLLRGANLGKLFAGFAVGSVALLIIVLSPVALITLEELGYYEPRFISWLDNYGLMFGFALMSIPPLIVMLTLTGLAMASRRNSSYRLSMQDEL